jgi:hypothetical protein
MLPKLLLLYKLAQQCEKGKHASIAIAADFPFTMNEIKRSFAEVARRRSVAGWLASPVGRAGLHDGHMPYPSTTTLSSGPIPEANLPRCSS